MVDCPILVAQPRISHVRYTYGIKTITYVTRLDELGSLRSRKASATRLEGCGDDMHWSSHTRE